MDVAILVESAGAIGDDRAGAFDFAGGQLLVVADGAGGTSGGAAAAQAVVDHLRDLSANVEQDWVEVLSRLDRHLSSSASFGETTAVVAFVTSERIVGASVGDSVGWMFALGIWLNLVEDQRRKPLLGSGSAVPIGFGPFPIGDRVLLGSDGLFNYVDAARLGELALLDPVDRAARELTRAARLPSGNLRDDVSVVIAG
jgi:PPM family protein phosphatase